MIDKPNSRRVAMRMVNDMVKRGQVDAASMSLDDEGLPVLHVRLIIPVERITVSQVLRRQEQPA